MRHTTELKQKSQQHTIMIQDAHHYTVESGTSGTIYQVTLLDGGGAACTCDWAKYRPASNQGRCACSHTLAVLEFIQQRGGRSMSTWAVPEDARRQHRHTIDTGDGVYITTRAA